MVGALQLADCSPVLCDADVPVPSSTITTLTATYRVETQWNLTGNRYLYERVKYSSLQSCQYDSETYGYRNGSWPVSVETADVATGTATWGSPTSSFVTGIYGKYLRPGTAVELAYNVPWKATKYTFTKTSSSGSYVNPLVTTQSFPAGGDCCSPIGTEPGDVVTAGTVTATSPSVATNLYMQWQACASASVAGLNLVLASGGVSLGPWYVSVGGGSVTFTDKNGTTYVYTGTLTSVAAAINSAGYFTATVGGQATLTGGVTNATVSDLVSSASLPLTRTSCTTSLNLVLPGYLLSPLSTGSYVAGCVFDPNLGYTDDKAGFESFVYGTKYASSSLFQSGSLGYFYQGQNFDFMLYTPTLDPDGYRVTPGPSVHTYDVVIPGVTSTTYNLTGIYYCSGSDPFNPCIPPVGPEYCNWFGVTQFDCNGNPVPSDCGGTSSACTPCVHADLDVTNLAEKTVTVVQTMTGSFAVS